MDASNAVFGKDFVEKLLPQKFPFVMLDKMCAYTETSIVSGLKVQSDNIFCKDDYFLEAGLIENMAQTVALHTGYRFFLKQEPAPVGYIGSIKNVAINRLPKINDVIQTTASVLQEFAGVTLVNISTTLNGVEIASAQMKTVLAK